MNRRIAVFIAIIGLNLMACCCGGVGNAPPAAQPVVQVNQVPIQVDDVPQVQPPPVKQVMPPDKLAPKPANQEPDPPENKKLAGDDPAIAYQKAIAAVDAKYAGELVRRDVKAEVERYVPRKTDKPVLISDIGGIKVELLSGSIAPITFTKRTVSGVRDLETDHDYLTLRVKIHNESGRPLKYIPWHFDSSKGMAKGDTGSLSFWSSGAKGISWPAKGVKDNPATIPIAGSVVDVVGVTVPGFKTEQIDLTLPAANVQSPGESFKFRITREFFESKEVRQASIEADYQRRLAKQQKILESIEDGRLAGVRQTVAREKMALREIEDARLALIARAKAEAEARRVAEASTRVAGAVTVTIDGGSIEKAAMYDRIRRQNTFSENIVMVVRVSVHNNSDTKIINYRSWGARSPLSLDSGSVRDEFGNRYKCFYPAFGLEFTGSVGPGARVDPMTSVRDVVVFDVPLEKAAELTVELPVFNIGQSGKPLSFTLPRSYFNK